ncbi:GNAT family N-acetyltransferase [Aliidiomarina iranensis]|uniref:GNAT family N-acetyltransferase n=1 Tax=Aliidiomarina iranensis TaxID=1434071 RepID=A0A432VQN6_9GAMM|nr:GNAT family N-acetyltransferase [Aliidiomarina iranensis]RUO18514.1 GNAT family N-acetyltransferase [Aliidiomarina iranensis]
MDITFVRSKNLRRAANFTFDNMRVYYEQFAPEWDVLKVYEVTVELDNYDIIYKQEVVGVMRLQFENDCCFLRDLQVISSAQNKGIGQVAIQEAKTRTLNANLSKLALRVLKISPAVSLYQRNGFVTQSEDERFFNMVAELS